MAYVYTNIVIPYDDPIDGMSGMTAQSIAKHFTWWREAGLIHGPGIGFPRRLSGSDTPQDDTEVGMRHVRVGQRERSKGEDSRWERVTSRER